MAKGKEFWQNVKLNQYTYLQYLDRLTELSISMFDWVNLPDDIDERFLELTLFTEGKAVFFKDDVLGFLALQVATGGKLNVYRIPIDRRAYADNGYQKNLDANDSILIYNNYLHSNSQLTIANYARKLYNIDRIIDINVNAQKTPILITCDEQQLLTLKNVYMKYDGNVPVIYGDKNINPNSIKVLVTGAPYLADKLYTLKTQVWNEALTYLGIGNVNTIKKERMITEEVNRTQNDVVANRFSRLKARNTAAKQINKMFGLNISCEYNLAIETLAEQEREAMQPAGGDDNE